MDDKASDIPGVTFHVVRSEYSGAGVLNDRVKLRGAVHLTAEIEDKDIWDEVIRRLDGYRVYSIDDFSQQLVLVMKDEREAAVKKLAEVQEEARVTAERAAQIIRFLTAERDSLDQQLKSAQQLLAQLEIDLS
jgi:hypothetical protein